MRVPHRKCACEVGTRRARGGPGTGELRRRNRQRIERIAEIDASNELTGAGPVRREWDRMGEFQSALRPVL